MEAATAPAGMSARYSINSTRTAAYALTSLVVLMLSTVRGRRRVMRREGPVPVLHFLPSSHHPHACSWPTGLPSPRLDGVLPVPGTTPSGTSLSMNSVEHCTAALGPLTLLVGVLLFPRVHLSSLSATDHPTALHHLEAFLSYLIFAVSLSFLALLSLPFVQFALSGRADSFHGHRISQTGPQVGKFDANSNVCRR